METRNGLFIKDIRIFRGLDLKDIVIVDNLSHSFGLQMFNGIPILEWRY
jgi:CTD small phosphatase-like protein 2